MLKMSYLPFLAALLVISVSSLRLIPSFWLAFIDHDDSLEMHETGVAAVASRIPFRETGPPACMAKIVMLRHKINQSTTRKRKQSVVRTRPVMKTPSPTPPRTRTSWSRFMGKQRN